MSLAGDLYHRWFERDPSGLDDTSESDAREALDWVSCAHHEKFMEWLRQETDRSFVIGDDKSVIQAAIRANAFREVRSRIERVTAEAQEFLKRKQEE